MAAKKTVKKTDEEILFPDINVGEYVVKPWNFGILFEISSLVEAVIVKAEEKGIEDQLNNIDDSFIPYTVILKIFTLCSNELLEIIAITLGISIEEVKGVSMKQGIELVMAIFKQNSTVIKNSLAPLFQAIPTVEEGKDPEEKVEK